MSKQWTIGIMAALGMILGKLLLPVLGNYIENRSINKVTISQVNSYIQNSIEITFSFNNYKYSRTYHEENFLSKGSALSEYGIRKNYTFYDSAYKKNFAIQMFDFPDVSSFDDLLDVAKHTLIKCDVNNSELKDAKFGTVENPVPIFKCIVPENDSLRNSLKARADIIKRNNEHYQKSIFYHLTYFTPKEEFQKMFPDQK